MAEIPGPSENLGKSPGGDRRHSRLLADFLFGDEPERADSALDRLRVDNNRRSLGMTEQERGTAEVLDWAKENGPGIAREGAMIVGPAVLTAAVWETAPQSHRAVETAVTAGLGVGTLMTLGGEVVRKTAELYPRFSKIAEAAVVVRSVGLVFTQIFASAGIGMVGAELADRLREAFKLSAAAQMGQPEIGGIGRVGGLPPDERSVSPSAPVAGGGEYNPPFTGPNVPVAPEPLPPVTAGPGAELTSRAVEVMPGDTLTKLVSEAGGNAYGPDLTQTILKSADALTGPQNPNSELAKNLIDHLNSHPDVTWQDVINGRYDSVMINGFPIKEVFSNAIHWIFPGQKFNVVVGAGAP